MARSYFSQTTDVVVALTAATAKTVLQLLAGTARIAIQGVTVTFDGVSPTGIPIVIQLIRQTTSGTSTARNPGLKDSDIGTALLVTGGKNFTVEPTSGAVLHTWHVHPQAGSQIALGLGSGEYIIPGTGRAGLVITAPANVNCLATIEGEE